jgi:putative ABC transport system permease protein
MNELGKDLLFAWRRAARSPGLTATAVLLIALGTGANFAIYSIVHAVLLQPLPFAEPDRLVAVFETSTTDPKRQQPFSVADYFDLQAQNHELQSLAGFHTWFYNLTGGGEPERVTGGVMTANLVSMLGVRPLAGRTFAADEQGPGGKHVALLGEDLWRRRFGADRALVGRTILLDDVPFTVVGVLPSSFDLPKGAKIWKPLAHGHDTSPRHFQFLQVVGRLKPGASVAALRKETAVIGARLAAQYPDTNEGRGVDAEPLYDQLVGEVRPALLVLFGAVIMMLALACLNVANLLLVRAQGRQGEIAVRLALGVSRPRLARQFVIEGLLLAFAGCGAGVVLAVWGRRLLVASSPQEVPRLDQAQIGDPVLGYALVIAAAAGLLFSVLPALWASRGDPGAVLRASTPGGGAGNGHRLVALLVIGEIAMALVLLVGSGLMIESFVRLRSIDPGFHPKGLLTLRFSLPEAKYPDGARATLFFRELEERLRRLPGVRSAAFGLTLPVSPGPKADNTFEIRGRPTGANRRDSAFIRPVSAAYFQTMGIPVVQGRSFLERDDPRSAAVALINEEMRRRYFAGESAVGQRLTMGARLGSMGAFDEIEREIVGVVGDVKYAGLGKEVVPEVYFPLAQGTWRSVGLVVRTAGDPSGLVKPVMREIWSLDPNLALSDVSTMEQNVAKSILQPKFYMGLLTIFAAMAWVLAMAGVYGVVSQAVGRRTQEIGIRMALGAGRSQILRRVLADGLAMALAGVVAGALGARLLSRVLEGLLFATSPRDPGAFLAVAALVMAAALAASWLPAYRATRVDPLVVLRTDGERT